MKSVVVLWWCCGEVRGDNITTTSAERAELSCASRQIRWGGRAVRSRPRPLPGPGLTSILSWGSQSQGRPDISHQTRGQNLLVQLVCHLSSLLASTAGLFSAECGLSVVEPVWPAPASSHRSVARNCAPSILCAHRTDLVEFKSRAGQDGSDEQTCTGTSREMNLCLLCLNQKY